MRVVKMQEYSLDDIFVKGLFSSSNESSAALAQVFSERCEGQYSAP